MTNSNYKNATKELTKVVKVLDLFNKDKALNAEFEAALNGLNAWLSFWDDNSTTIVLNSWKKALKANKVGAFVAFMDTDENLPKSLRENVKVGTFKRALFAISNKKSEKVSELIITEKK